MCLQVVHGQERQIKSSPRNQSMKKKVDATNLYLAIAIIKLVTIVVPLLIPALKRRLSKADTPTTDITTIRSMRRLDMPKQGIDNNGLAVPMANHGQRRRGSEVSRRRGRHLGRRSTALEARSRGDGSGRLGSCLAARSAAATRAASGLCSLGGGFVHAAKVGFFIIFLVLVVRLGALDEGRRYRSGSGGGARALAG